MKKFINNEKTKKKLNSKKIYWHIEWHNTTLIFQKNSYYIYILIQDSLFGICLKNGKWIEYFDNLLLFNRHIISLWKYFIKNNMQVLLSYIRIINFTNLFIFYKTALLSKKRIYLLCKLQKKLQD